jgi:hypothetical protein
MAGIFEQFMQGRQLAQQEALNRLRMQQAQQSAPFQQRLQQLELERAQQRLQSGQQQQQQASVEQQREQAILAGRLAEQALDITDPDIRSTFLRGAAQRVGITEEFDPDTVTNEDLMQLISAKQALEPSGRMSELQKGRTVLVEQDGKMGFATSVFNPATSETTTSFSPIEGDLVSELGESRSEQMDSRIDESRRKAQAAGLGKASAQSISEKVNGGLLAADSTAILRRSLSLLDEIDTGGFNAVKIKAKQFVGAEGADEGELVFNLAKNVLQQLKTTFGAAFTAAEGDRLESIEAGIGRSTESNRRIINQALRLADRAARRGLDAASKGGESFSFEADEIKKALEFNLEPQPQVDAGPAQIVPADKPPQTFKSSTGIQITVE